jgi:hypothetical protein
MSALHDPKEGSTSLKNRLGSEISQLVQRGFKGLDYISSPPPAVGCSAPDPAVPSRYSVAVPLPGNGRGNLSRAASVRDACDPWHRYF